MSFFNVSPEKLQLLSLLSRYFVGPHYLGPGPSLEWRLPPCGGGCYSFGEIHFTFSEACSLGSGKDSFFIEQVIIVLRGATYLVASVDVQQLKHDLLVLQISIRHIAKSCPRTRGNGSRRVLDSDRCALIGCSRF